MTIKVLYITKDPDIKGGISNFSKIFTTKFKNNKIKLVPFIQGERKRYKNILLRFFTYIIFFNYDIIRINILLFFNKDIKIIHLNPSFSLVPIIRDSLFILIFLIHRKKIVVLYHGWNEKFYNRLKKLTFLRRYYTFLYSKAIYSFVLSNEFKIKLKKFGIKNIQVIKTMFDEENYTEKITNISKNYREIVYMGRLQKDKGIFELLDIIPLFKKSQTRLKFIFIGWYCDEDTKKKVKEKIKSNSIDDYCEFTGYLEGKEKLRKLSQSDIFVFPSYREGCPTSVIEALATGLFIVATDVGAINEIIQDGINGYLVKPRDSSDLYSKIVKALNRDDLNNIRQINKQRAMENFSSRSIIKIIQDIYLKILM